MTVCQQKHTKNCLNLCLSKSTMAILWYFAYHQWKNLKNVIVLYHFLK